MKKIITAVATLALALCVSSTFAQKMGRINLQEMVMAMPETATMQTNLEAFRKDLSDNFETMQVEFNTKLADYQANMNTLSASLKDLREKELQDLQTRMQQFEQSAMQEIQAKQAELLNPIIEKAHNAVSKVATSGGYDVVYDESVSALAYVNSTTVTDIAPLVKKELGI